MRNVLNDWVGDVAVKDYMNTVVDIVKRTNEIKTFADLIILARIDSEVHVHEGIFVLADAAGETLTERSREDSINGEANHYPYEYYFDYKGIRFFQISKERIMHENI